MTEELEQLNQAAVVTNSSAGCKQNYPNPILRDKGGTWNWKPVTTGAP
jgi:hypothetical protein